MSEEIRIIETGDGSQSLYNSMLRETYHSTHGALTESRHVFIQMGLENLREKGDEDIRILEVGLGTGLNALLSIKYARDHSGISIDYHTLEPYPLDTEIVSQLSYPDMLAYEEAKSDFAMIHSSSWGSEQRVITNFSFTKYKEKIEHFSPDQQFELVFFDAFAPSKQSEVWELGVLKNVVEHMAEGGVLVTYSAKGQFKRDLASLGLVVETLDGPPGKKEMVRATK